MKISVIATTNVSYKAKKEEFDNFSGKSAGVCYLSSSFEELVNEEKDKTLRRVNQTKSSGHHSVYDHPSISLYLENIPKILAMLINNEHMYTTSEKSARYTKFKLEENEQRLYDKWLEIFKAKIRDEYQEKYPDYFNDKKIEKLAQENSRYLVSIFMPTSMVYTTSYRQINLLYAFMKKELETPSNDIMKKLNATMNEFCTQLENEGFIDEKLSGNDKNRSFSLFTDYYPEEYFGDVYMTTYKGSFAQLAQAQRHRTLNYNISILKEPSFFVPPIIRKEKELVTDWLKDLESQKENYPQGMLVDIHESGSLDMFILKMYERKCTNAQLEINNQTDSTLNKYVDALSNKNHKRANELKEYTKGSRCSFKGYKCTSPCGFKEGISGNRII